MYNTPYYLAGNSKYRYHQHKASKATAKGGAVAVGAGLLLHPTSRYAAAGFVDDRLFMRSGGAYQSDFATTHAKSLGYGAAAVAGGFAVHAGIHSYRAHKLKKEYYYRKQNGKNVRVKKGNRK